jgi:N-methylhydantoinase B
MTEVAELDPITLAVIQNGLVNITSQMDAALARTAFSPVISEGQDRASGVYSSSGEVIAQGPSSLPLFISTMQDAVEVTIERWPSLLPGDVVVVNDPYLVGTHMQDVRLVRPFYDQGEILFYLANTGHWTDVGGMSPGSFCVGAREIQQEGVRIPPVRLVHEGVIQSGLVEIILANLRIPANADGDLRAQLNALDVGERQLRRFLDKYGRQTVTAAVAELRRRGESAMRSHIREIPDGVYLAESFLDNDGIDDEPIRVHLTVTVNGDSLVCDFSGSSGFVRGPLNSTTPTTRAGVFAAIKHLFPDVPTNAGYFEPVSFIIPDTTFLNAGYPRAVSGCSAEVSSATADAFFRAMSAVLPYAATAGCYSTMAAFTLGGVDPATGRAYVLYSFNGGGYGGGPDQDGMANGPLPVGIAQAPAVEVMEQRYPIVYDKFALREASGGAGRYRGGLGVQYEVRLLRGTATSSALMNNGKFAPWGCLGGADGTKTELEYVLSGDRFVPPLTSKADGVPMEAGDKLIIRTPGGGGWGPPAERERDSIQHDADLGYYSAADLAAAYDLPSDWRSGPRQ